MIAIKDMKEAPSGCDRCELFPVCKHRDIYNENYKPNDCPLIEIVTCEECKYRDTRTEKDGFTYCPKKRMDTHKDHFCSDAERKNNAAIHISNCGFDNLCNRLDAIDWITNEKRKE